MSFCSIGSRVLVTGASGFLGRYLMTGLSEHFEVTGFDPQTCENCIQGSVTDQAAVERAVADCDALVIAHMAPNKPEVYATPEVPFDVNVKGTGLLLHAAAQCNLRRIVLISSLGVVDGARTAGKFLARNLPPSPAKLYGLTKTLQEATARYYHKQHGLEVAILRPAYISLGDTLEDKYGKRRESVNWQFIDPRDIADAARAALMIEKLGFETFYLMAGPGAEEKADIAHTTALLGWQPRYRFTEFSKDKA